MMKVFRLWQPKNLKEFSFFHFREKIKLIFSVNTWQHFFRLMGVRGPATRADMDKMLKTCVQNSRKKRYHKAGMDFSRVQASGTSKILSRGQTYSASSGLKNVVFHNSWTYERGRKYLDASCLLYNNTKLIHTFDYMSRRDDTGAVLHSGDVMRDGGGTHTIRINLQKLAPEISSCVFVLSSWKTTLANILTTSISCSDEDKGPNAAPLCTYDLDAHDKISHLTSVVMCKLYRTRNSDGWHVQAIGDVQRGDASNYGPIYSAVEKLL